MLAAQQNAFFRPGKTHSRVFLKPMVFCYFQLFSIVNTKKPIGFLLFSMVSTEKLREPAESTVEQCLQHYQMHFSGLGKRIRALHAQNLRARVSLQGLFAGRLPRNACCTFFVYSAHHRTSAASLVEHHGTSHPPLLRASRNIGAIFTGLGCPTRCCLDEYNQPQARFGYPVPLAGGRPRS